MRMTTLAVLAGLCLGIDARAWQCTTIVDVLGWELDDIPPADKERRERMQAAVAWAQINIGDVAFEGRLTTETRSPIRDSDFEYVLMEFRDIVWLRGPKAGLAEDRVDVLSQ